MLRQAASIILCGTLATTVSASERLVYAVTRGGFGNSTTEIFAVSAEDPQPARLFTDESLPVVIGPIPRGSSTGPDPDVVLGNHMFAPGRQRSALYDVTSIFEFFLDGSGRYRKLLDLPAGERVDLLTIAPDGTKLAYLSLRSGALTVFVHDVKTGSLLRKLDMYKIAGECPVRNLGWLPDNHTLFFTLEEGDNDAMEDADYKRLGTWLMHDDGTFLKHLPASVGAVQEEGYNSGPDLPPVMLGVVEGQYLFRVALYKRSRTPPFQSFLALAGPSPGNSTKVVIEGNLAGISLGRSGHHLGYLLQERSKYVGNVHVAPPVHLWIRNLSGGESKEILSMETGTERALVLTLLGWMEQ